MSTQKNLKVAADLPYYDRNTFASGYTISCLGDGMIGGKATGLVGIQDVLTDYFDTSPFPGFDVSIPRMVIIATDVFDRFMERNSLYQIISNNNASDKNIAIEFQRASLPTEILGDLRVLITGVKTPLAIRSSSMLEDAMYEPFAGVYETKMIPNNQPEIDTRFRKLTEAIKYIYASTFFRAAQDYRKIINKESVDEKMAVIIQEVAGEKHGNSYYPHISGVARSYNFYPVGRAKPDEGVVNLALGLGKTIVDSGLAWSYSPALPHVSPPVGSVAELLKASQNKFWAVNMGKPPEYDPINEAEFLSHLELSDAEYDGTLKYVASTYQAANDRLVMGIGSKGARLINFAPILKAELFKLNDLTKKLIQLCEEALEVDVEIEFAVTLASDKGQSRLGFLQVRPMVVSNEVVALSAEEINDANNLAASENVLGNGIVDNILDIVYVDPEKFEAKHTRQIGEEIETINKNLVDQKRPYLLIGFGRWGSSDPWLGIPVEWNQISGARAIIEATLPNMNIEFSQGSHFFHNLSSFQICYFLIYYSGKYKIDWLWLNDQNEIARTDFVRHVRISSPLEIKVDGRSGRGVVKK
jgi:hypothetical protein